MSLPEACAANPFTIAVQKGSSAHPWNPVSLLQQLLIRSLLKVQVLCTRKVQLTRPSLNNRQGSGYFLSPPASGLVVPRPELPTERRVKARA